MLGIVLMNIVAFAMPQAAYSNPRAFGAETALDYAAWAVTFVLVDGKMRALFSMLFGASMLLVIQRAEEAGRDGQQVHFRRMAWLLVFGAAHALLVWFGDILVLYAVVGMIAWFFAETGTRKLLRYGVLLIAVQLLVWLVLFFSFRDMAQSAAAPNASIEQIGFWTAINAQMGLPTRFDLAEEIALYRESSWAALVRHRIGTAGPFFELLVAGPETLGYMLIGMAGLRSGFLTGRWKRACYRRAAILGYAIGLPPMIALALLCFVRDFDALTVLGAAFVAALPFRPILMIAHAALALLWLTGRPSRLAPRIIAAGRAAFTNYLGTSLILSTLFYGYGFGLYASLDRAALYGVVLAMWAVMLLWSKPWLDRFAQGPFEWAWRSLARGRFEPLRKAIAS